MEGIQIPVEKCPHAVPRIALLARILRLPRFRIHPPVERVAAERGIPYVIVNRGPTDHDGRACVTLRLEGDVTAIFPPAVGEAIGSIA